MLDWRESSMGKSEFQFSFPVFPEQAISKLSCASFVKQGLVHNFLCGNDFICM